MNKNQRARISNDVTDAIKALSDVFRFVTQNHMNEACRAWASHILSQNDIELSNTNLLEVSEMLFKGMSDQSR